MPSHLESDKRQLFILTGLNGQSTQRSKCTTTVRRDDCRRGRRNAGDQSDGCLQLLIKPQRSPRPRSRKERGPWSHLCVLCVLGGSRKHLSSADNRHPENACSLNFGSGCAACAG